MLQRGTAGQERHCALSLCYTCDEDVANYGFDECESWFYDDLLHFPRGWIQRPRSTFTCARHAEQGLEVQVGPSLASCCQSGPSVLWRRIAQSSDWRAIIGSILEINDKEKNDVSKMLNKEWNFMLLHMMCRGGSQNACDTTTSIKLWTRNVGGLAGLWRLLHLVHHAKLDQLGYQSW